MAKHFVGRVTLFCYNKTIYVLILLLKCTEILLLPLLVYTLDWFLSLNDLPQIDLGDTAIKVSKISTFIRTLS